MSLENEIVKLQSELRAYKTVQSTYSDSAKLYKAVFNPGAWTTSSWGVRKYKLTCNSIIPLSNAVFQISPQPGFSPQIMLADVSPMIDNPNIFYWAQTPVDDSTDAKYFAPSAVTILSNVPFELSAVML